MLTVDIIHFYVINKQFMAKPLYKMNLVSF